MTGYASDWSMSNNAVDAYSRGLRPMSKWKKQAILAELPTGEVERLALHLLPLALLREEFLEYEEWHHTSKQYNETCFYRPEIPEWAEDAAAVADFADEWRRRRTDAENAARSSAKPVKARVAYTVWDERKRPRQVEEYALVIGTWAHTESGRRKRTGGSHFRVIERYKRAPRGTAAVFAGIASNMGPKSKKRPQR